MSASSETIGVSCGHRVPRVPVKVGVRKLYWCDECGEHRMSGGSSNGERAFDWLLELADEITRAGVVVEDPGTDRGRMVVQALGARIAA